MDFEKPPLHAQEIEEREKAEKAKEAEAPSSGPDSIEQHESSKGMERDEATGEPLPEKELGAAHPASTEVPENETAEKPVATSLQHAGEGSIVDGELSEDIKIAQTGIAPEKLQAVDNFRGRVAAVQERATDIAAAKESSDEKTASLEKAIKEAADGLKQENLSALDCERLLNNLSVDLVAQLGVTGYGSASWVNDTAGLKEAHDIAERIRTEIAHRGIERLRSGQEKELDDSTRARLTHLFMPFEENHRIV
jgi:hypothetical protein